MNNEKQEIELLKRKKKRAKNIAKIRFRRNVDNYIKERVYIIIIVALIFISILLRPALKVEERTDDVIQLQQMMHNLMKEYSEDELLKDNKKLIHICDSMEILLFVYNRRHQRDNKIITDLRYRNDTTIILAETYAHNDTLTLYTDSLEQDTTFRIKNN